MEYHGEKMNGKSIKINGVANECMYKFKKHWVQTSQEELNRMVNLHGEGIKNEWINE